MNGNQKVPPHRGSHAEAQLKKTTIRSKSYVTYKLKKGLSYSQFIDIAAVKTARRSLQIAKDHTNQPPQRGNTSVENPQRATPESAQMPIRNQAEATSTTCPKA